MALPTIPTMNPQSPTPVSPEKLRIAAFLSHPTQLHIPWFKALGRRTDLAFKAFFFSRVGMDVYQDKDFRHSFQWDNFPVQGYDHEFLPSVPGLPDTYLGRLRLNLGIRRAVRSTPWDAILNVAYSYPSNWVVWREARAGGIPLIFQSDSNLLKPRPLWRKAIKAIPVRYYFQGLSIFLSCGDFNEQYLRRYGARPQNLWPCPIPLDVERYRRCQAAPDWQDKLEAVRRKCRIAPEDKVVVFCGKIIAYKRPLDLIQALRKLDLDRVKILFIGSGPLSAAVQKALPDQVRKAGFINQSELPYYFGVGSILVCPSDHDAHPAVVTEALSLGIPCIVSDRCGCYGPHDVLRPGENGLVYPVGNVDALAQALKLLLVDDPALCRRMSVRAQELAATQDAAVAAEALVAAVRDFLGQNRVMDRDPAPALRRVPSRIPS
jgi:glycosyltransferase involved in cell wall biosynthesis